MFKIEQLHLTVNIYIIYKLNTHIVFCYFFPKIALHSYVILLIFFGIHLQKDRYELTAIMKKEKKSLFC